MYGDNTEGKLKSVSEVEKIVQRHSRGVGVYVLDLTRR